MKTAGHDPSWKQPASRLMPVAVSLETAVAPLCERRRGGNCVRTPRGPRLQAQGKSLPTFME